jgi:hypothetical protein
MEGGLQKWSISLYGISVRELGGIKEGSEDGHLFPWGPCWESYERAHMPWTFVWKKVPGQVSLPLWAPLGNLEGGGGAPTGNFEEGSGFGEFLSLGALLEEPGRGAPLLGIL